MKNVKLITEYDGTKYHGWQIQKNAETIQGEIEKAVYKLTGEYSEVNGCSRTDKGVHAFGHVSSFVTSSSIPSEKFCFALNSVLPKDIVVKHSCEEAKDFHARFSCTGKKYMYRIYNCNTQSALLKDRAWFEPRVLDTEAMKRAAEYYVGEFDFSAFQAVGSSVQTTVRKIFSTDVRSSESLNGGKDIFFEVSGSGFLYNMVRIMAGTLLEVGKGRINPEDISDIIILGKRAKAGVTAPPQGLYLKEVYYGSTQS